MRWNERQRNFPISLAPKATIHGDRSDGKMIQMLQLWRQLLGYSTEKGPYSNFLRLPNSSSSSIKSLPDTRLPWRIEIEAVFSFYFFSTQCSLSLSMASVAAAWLIGIIIVLCQVSTPSAQGGNPTSVIIALSVVCSVVGFLILVAIGIFSYKFAKNVVPDVVKEWRNTSTPPPDPAPAPAENRDVMEIFLLEIADESPVRFTAQQLRAFTSNYSTRLGSGGFGDVYKGQFPNGVEIAVKILKRNSEKKAEEQFMAEMRTIGRTRHRNLVRLYGFCYDEFVSALVLEYMENGSLDRFLYGKRNYEIVWEKLQEIAIGTARGIAYLHEECERRIIHYDIKPANILLDANFSPRVGDFGLANLCNRDNTHVSLTEYRGTPGYSAPELLMFNFPVTFKCDVYSFGMVLFEIVGRRKNATVGPSGSIDWFPIQVWERFEKGELAETGSDCDVEEDGERKKAVERMCTVALWCVQDSPEDRPPMSTVAKMLEGSVEIMPPPKPFQYMFPISSESSAVAIAMESDQTNSGSTSSYSMSKGSLHTWYKDSAPILRTSKT
ncbi:rust resistance kinase Lr10-like isoform X2 [Momordica charantia]|uniref:Rust resistance kinase Lr10-like isoform X2 n=1 Tax=Momordica charantia TaxID=3673 RepID=A0A6J1C423_MOMCH|nr:rust resistance kinase Lr10-like isoform X2 [Momordica charantia]